MHVRSFCFVPFLLAAGCGLLSGCSSSVAFPSVQSNETTSPADAGDRPSTVLKGRLHGGQQPIVGAKIYLLAAGTTGYGSAATSLLTSAAYAGYPSVQDGTGRYYVLTDSGGNFQIADTCTPGTQVYVTSVGGNPGAGSNTAANEIALLGQCPANGNFDSTLTGVFVSEISTVAAAYAASAYAVDTFDIGAPATGATGIANAFANAANLFDVQNFNDTARTVPLGGLGVVPQTKIHTIANLLASCINSTGPASAACSILFSNAKSAGTSGTTPSDVTTAAINIAHNPWANVSALLPLQTSVTPFYPQMPSSGANAPGDLTIALTFTGAALGSNPSLAVDGNGAVWSLVPGQTVVSKLSPQGTLLSGASGYAIGGGFAGSRALAFDTSNNLWVLGLGSYNYGTNATYAELSNTGVYQKLVNQPGTTVYTNPLTIGVNPPSAITNLVLDGAGNFYYGSQYVWQVFGTTVSFGNCCTVKYNMGTSTVTNLDNGNTTPGTNFVAVGSAVWATTAANNVSYTSQTSKSVTGGGLSTSMGVALDHAGNAWVVNSGNSTVSEFNSSGVAVSSSTGFSGGLSTPRAIAVDGLGKAWVTNSGGSYDLSEFTSAGAVVGSGFMDPNLSSAAALVIDGSGNAWLASSTSGTITEFLGVAAPVVTPMSAAIAAGSLGARP